VVDNFVEEYFAGRTPNPCIRCNMYLKWDALIKQADLLNVYWIATGHYAIIDRTNPNNPILKKGKDPKKDQSYVLWGINRKTLKRTLFPLGFMSKDTVRKIAREANMVTAEVPESQEICFVTDNDYRRFLKDYAPEKVAQETIGRYVSDEGEVLGEHQGISQYTVGQRRGLGITKPEPLYVQNINTDDKTITLVDRSKMFFGGCTITEINWLQDLDDYSDKPIDIHIRYNHDGVPCQISMNNNGSLTVNFESPQFAVTPGQSAVFYSGDILLGGGIIAKGMVNESS
jgi:tRNA-specific 2-thiouridylase